MVRNSVCCFVSVGLWCAHFQLCCCACSRCVCAELAPAFQDAHGAAFESVSKEEALSKKALKLLRGIMTKYSDPSRVSKIAEIEVKVAEVQAQMQDNIDKALARQERVNTVDGKAETMADSSKTFFQRSRNVRRTVQMRYYKLVCIMATVVIVILLYILLPLLM